jgi:hypothetical protein
MNKLISFLKINGEVSCFEELADETKLLLVAILATPIKGQQEAWWINGKKDLLATAKTEQVSDHELIKLFPHGTIKDCLIKTRPLIEAELQKRGYLQELHSKKWMVPNTGDC